MSERDTLAALLRTLFPSPSSYEEWLEAVDRTYEDDADRLIAAGVRVAPSPDAPGLREAARFDAEYDALICGAKHPNGKTTCRRAPGHDDDHGTARLDVTWPAEPVDECDHPWKPYCKDCIPHAAAELEGVTCDNDTPDGPCVKWAGHHDPCNARWYGVRGDTVMLSPREQEVVALTAAGLTDKAIAGEMGLSPHTVENHQRSIREKVGVQSRVEAVVWWLDHICPHCKQYGHHYAGCQKWPG